MDRHFRHEQGCQCLLRADDLMSKDGDSTRELALHAEWLTQRLRWRDDKEGTDTRNRAPYTHIPRAQLETRAHRHTQLMPITVACAVCAVCAD
jgi:hypothetical protein